MPLIFEELQVLKTAETLADSIWKHVCEWDPFAKDVVGKQLTRAVDSIGANIAEAFGRYHFGEKLQFLYFARGSAFETKYWLNRASTRDLFSSVTVQSHISDLTKLSRQLNSFAATIKRQRSHDSIHTKIIREPSASYQPQTANSFLENSSEELFSENDISFLESFSSIPNIQSLVPNKEYV